MGGHRRPRIFIDADVIFSKTLRDWVGLLYTCEFAQEPPFDVHWSDDVLAEAINSLRNKHPEWSGGQIAHVREVVSRTFEVGRVREFDVAASGFRGTDPGDAHVHAAAVACDAGYLVTGNVADFLPVDADDDLPYEVVTPDTFFCLAAESHPELVTFVIREQITYRNQRGESVDLCAALDQAGCPSFAQEVLSRLQWLARVGG